MYSDILPFRFFISVKIKREITINENKVRVRVRKEDPYSVEENPIIRWEPPPMISADKASQAFFLSENNINIAEIIERIAANERRMAIIPYLSEKALRSATSWE